MLMLTKLMESPKALKILRYGHIHATRSPTFQRDAAYERSPGVSEALAAIDAGAPAVLVVGRAGTGKTRLGVCKLVGVITPLLLLPCGHHLRAGSPDSVDGKRPRACRSARLCVRRGRAARSLCSSASAAPWS